MTFHAAEGSVPRIIEYRYDAFDRLIARLDNTDGLGVFEEKKYYIHDSAPGKGDLDDIVLTYDENDNVLHRYLYGPAVDQIFSDESAVDGLLWALADRQGRVRDWADYNEATDTASVYNHVEYDSFGNIESQSNVALGLLRLFGAGPGPAVANHVSQEITPSVSVSPPRFLRRRQSVRRRRLPHPLQVGFGLGFLGQAAQTLPAVSLLRVMIRRDRNRCHYTRVSNVPTSPVWRTCS